MRDVRSVAVTNGGCWVVVFISATGARRLWNKGKNMPDKKTKMTPNGLESVKKTQHDNIVDNPKASYKTSVARKGKRNTGGK